MEANKEPWVVIKQGSETYLAMRSLPRSIKLEGELYTHASLYVILHSDETDASEVAEGDEDPYSLHVLLSVVVTYVIVIGKSFREVLHTHLRSPSSNYPTPRS